MAGPPLPVLHLLPRTSHIDSHQTATSANERALLAPQPLQVHTSFGDSAVKAFGNLPGQLTSFVGREATVTMVRHRLGAEQLVSLVGPGGCGKTRLAIEIGREMADRRPDGVFFVDLSGLSDPGLVPGAVLRALGLRAAPGRDPGGVLVGKLCARNLLLLLDNCEHLVDASASLADALARGCPGVHVLATSRERLG